MVLSISSVFVRLCPYSPFAPGWPFKFAGAEARDALAGIAGGEVCFGCLPWVLGSWMDGPHLWIGQEDEIGLWRHSQLLKY